MPGIIDSAPDCITHAAGSEAARVDDSADFILQADYADCAGFGTFMPGSTYGEDGSSAETLYMILTWVGIVGVSGYGGSELLRLSVGHPAFEVVYVSGESTAGQRLDRQFPALAGHPTGSLVIQPFVPEEVQGVDVLFASLPTGKSREPLARVPREVKIDFGVLEFGDDPHVLAGYREKPHFAFQVSMGLYILDPLAWDYLTPGEPLLMPDLLEAMRANDLPVHCFRQDCEWLDIGRHDDYTAANALFEARRAAFLGDIERPKLKIG